LFETNHSFLWTALKTKKLIFIIFINATLSRIISSIVKFRIGEKTLKETLITIAKLDAWLLKRNFKLKVFFHFYLRKLKYSTKPKKKYALLWNYRKIIFLFLNKEKINKI